MKTLRERWNIFRWAVIAVWSVLYVIRLIDNSMGAEPNTVLQTVSFVCVLIIGIDLIVGAVRWLINLGRKVLKKG